MKEAHMVEAVQEALGRLGIEDAVAAAGLFFPRGHTGAMFAGGLAGGGIGEALGGMGEDVGVVAGAMGGSGPVTPRPGFPVADLLWRASGPPGGS